MQKSRFPCRKSSRRAPSGEGNRSVAGAANNFLGRARVIRTYPGSHVWICRRAAALRLPCDHARLEMRGAAGRKSRNQIFGEGRCSIRAFCFLFHKVAYCRSFFFSSRPTFGSQDTDYDILFVVA